MDPCPPHDSLTPPSNWIEFDFEKEIPYLDIPPINPSQYVPSLSLSSSSSSSSSGSSAGVTSADLQNLLLVQGEMKDLLLSMNDKIDTVLSRMSKLEMKVQSLERTVQMKK